MRGAAAAAACAWCACSVPLLWCCPPDSMPRLGGLACPACLSPTGAAPAEAPDLSPDPHSPARLPKASSTLATTQPRTPPPRATTPPSRLPTTAGRWAAVGPEAGASSCQLPASAADGCADSKHVKLKRVAFMPCFDCSPAAPLHLTACPASVPLRLPSAAAGHQGHVRPDLGRGPRRLQPQLARSQRHLGRRHVFGLGPVAGGPAWLGGCGK